MNGLWNSVESGECGNGLRSEVPVTAPRNGGGQWNDMIDLLVRLPGGEVVVVDHKSTTGVGMLGWPEAQPFQSVPDDCRDGVAAR